MLTNVVIGTGFSQGLGSRGLRLDSADAAGSLRLAGLLLVLQCAPLQALGLEARQLKWFAYGTAVFLVGVFFVQFEQEQTNRWLVFAVIVICLLAIPVTVGIAILKHHLYDIDVVINRTLVYGVLTATLVAVYFGGVTVTQALFRTLTAQEKQSQLAIVVSTLVIAALFNPLRRRIQSFIDKRFYRRKYDARKTLEAFSTKLSHETDLDALSDDLVGVVREAMQPAHVSLWLRPDTPQKVTERTSSPPG